MRRRCFDFCRTLEPRPCHSVVVLSMSRCFSAVLCGTVFSSGFTTAKPGAAELVAFDPGGRGKLATLHPFHCAVCLSAVRLDLLVVKKADKVSNFEASFSTSYSSKGPTPAMISRYMYAHCGASWIFMYFRAKAEHRVTRHERILLASAGLAQYNAQGSEK